MKIVIIEDEKLTAKDLQRTLLAVEPDLDIIAMLHSVEDAIGFFKNQVDVDLIFSDIQLGDGLSFEIFKNVEVQVPIIFCTAFDHYLSEAFNATGIHYILKPFSKQDIEKALNKFLDLQMRFNKNRDKYKGQIDYLESKFSVRKSAVIVRNADKVIPIDINTIALFYIHNGYTYAHTFSQEKYMVSENLELLEQRFVPKFFRMNRQYLVNRKAVKDASNFFNRKMLINLTVPFKEQILVGKLKTSAFIDWLESQ
jgi:two-component system, LytTR family, response regulator LytT